MKKIACFAYVNDGDYLWISHFKFNGLFKIDLKSDEVSFMGRFSSCGEEKSQLHHCARKHGSKLYFFPQNGDYVDIYDIETEKFFDVKIPIMYKQYQKTIINTFMYDDMHIMIPRFVDIPVMIFPSEAPQKIEKIDLTESRKCIRNGSMDLTLYACIVDDTIYFPIKDTNCIGSFNVREKKENVIILEGLDKIVGDIEYDGENIWISANDGIYKWFPQDNSLVKVCDVASNREQWIEKIIVYKNNIICVPRWLNKIIIIDKESLQHESISIDTDKLNQNVATPWRDVRGVFVWNEKIVILPVRYSETIFIDLNSFHIDYKTYVSNQCMYSLNRVTVMEQNGDNFSEFLEFIDSLNFKDKIMLNKIGKTIYEEIVG